MATKDLAPVAANDQKAPRRKRTHEERLADNAAQRERLELEAMCIEALAHLEQGLAALKKLDLAGAEDAAKQAYEIIRRAIDEAGTAHDVAEIEAP